MPALSKCVADIKSLDYHSLLLLELAIDDLHLDGRIASDESDAAETKVVVDADL